MTRVLIEAAVAGLVLVWSGSEVKWYLSLKPFEGCGPSLTRGNQLDCF